MLAAGHRFRAQQELGHRLDIPEIGRERGRDDPLPSKAVSQVRLSDEEVSGLAHTAIAA